MEAGKTGYSILSLVQAAIGGAMALGVGVLYALSPGSLRDVGLTEMMGGIGLVVVLYYFSLHQIVRRRQPGLSALIITALSTGNVALLIAQTGGLDSPFYSFWLLVIVLSGAFGGIFTTSTATVTTLYFIYTLYQHNFDTVYVGNHLLQLLAGVAAAVLAEVVYYRGRRQGARTSETVADLHGELTQEQEKARAIMDAMADAVVMIGTDAKIQLFNPAAQALTGWDPASALGLDYKAVLNLRTAKDEPLADTLDPFQMVLHTKEAASDDTLNLVTRAGKRTELHISVSPINDRSGKPIGGVAVFRDISKEKEVERQRDEFISTASHEMRTPIAAIEGYIALALSDKVATVDDRAREYLTKAHDSTKHLADLFRDLLSATKLEDTKRAKQLEVVDVSQVVKSVVDDLQFNAKEHNLSIAFQAGTNQSAQTKTIAPIYTAMANPERLREVVMNLIENAFKYTKEGNVTVSVGGDAEQVTVSVHDTGIGIPPEDIPHLFQKFYRVDNSATREIGGTGLGLYLCRAVIESFNGRIWAESQFGKGSTFSFQLPRTKQTATKLIQPGQIAESANTKAIDGLKVPAGSRTA